MNKGKIVKAITESENHVGHLIYRTENINAAAAKYIQNIPNTAILKKK